MKRFLMQSNKLAKVTTATTTATNAATSTTTDTSTYIDATGFEQVCVLSRVVSTTGDPTIKLYLKGAKQAAASTTTTFGTVSWTGGTTGDIGALQAQVNAKGEAYNYFAVKLVSKSGKTALRNLYFLGGARRQPISTTTASTEDDQHHINTVKSTTVVVT